MLRRMVLSDWPSTPWLENQTLFFELLDIKLIQLERRLILRHTGPSRLKWRCREIHVRFPSGFMLLYFYDE